MRIKIFIFLGASAFLISLSGGQSSQRSVYPWLNKYDGNQSIKARIAVPLGYERVEAASDSFGHWLRMLPLKKGNPPVYLYNGKKKGNQAAQAAVIDIDVGNRDLQQCADAVIRLRAEYFFAGEKFDLISFRFTSGHTASLEKWQQGFRPKVTGNNVRWVKKAKNNKTYQGFRKYLNTVFVYAGSYSLSRELESVARKESMHIGDVFIQAGFPGHAVMVVDVAKSAKSGGTIFLLAQSYMPAQEVHLLKNPLDSAISPWYRYQPEKVLVTPEWPFKPGHLKRFK